MIPEMKKSDCREKPAHGIFPQTHADDGYRSTIQQSAGDIPGWTCLADVTMWKCTILECLASMMYTFMLTWVTIAPGFRDHKNAGYLSYYRYYNTKNYDWVSHLPATIVNVCLLPLIIFTFARSSGGFVNPSITFAAYFLRRIFLLRTAMYVGGQVIGRVLAGWAVQEAYGSTAFDMGYIISPKVVSISDAYIVEIIVRFAMVVTVMYIAAGRKPGVLFGDAMSPWMVGIATEAAFWLSRLIWQEYPGRSRSLPLSGLETIFNRSG